MSVSTTRDAPLDQAICRHRVRNSLAQRRSATGCANTVTATYQVGGRSLRVMLGEDLRGEKENAMRGFNAAAVAALAIMSGSSANVLAGVPSQTNGIRGALEALSSVETVQYYWGGRRYCFYDDPWHGPGWYWCGYAYRTGFGWGGPFGWHHWRGGSRHIGEGSRHGGDRFHGTPSRSGTFRNNPDRGFSGAPGSPRGGTCDHVGLNAAAAPRLSV